MEREGIHLPLGRRDETPRDISQPEPGFFMIRQHPSKLWVPAVIHCDGEVWAAEINGAFVGLPSEEPNEEVWRIWEYGRRITEAEFHEATAMQTIKRTPFGL